MNIRLENALLDNHKKPVLVCESETSYTSAKTLESPRDIADMLRTVFRLHERAEEYVYLICLTAKNHPISIFELSHGTVNSSQVGMREILLRALLCGAVSIVISHNHPSGICFPSETDNDMTTRLKEACSIIGISLLDHIILGEDGYYSYMEAESL